MSRTHEVLADIETAESLVRKALMILGERGLGRELEASAVGVMRTTMDGWRSGRYMPGLPQLMGLMRAAGVRIALVPLGDESPEDEL